MKANIKMTFLMFFTILMSIVCYTQNNNIINWEEDLKFYESQLEKKHIDLYHTISKKEFKKKLSTIKTLSKNVSDLKVILELMKLSRQVGDGHTAISLRNLDTHLFPFEVKLIENEWRVVKVSKFHKNLLRKSLVAIDGVPIDEVTTKVSEIAQFVENKYSQYVRTGDYLTISELLYALNITRKKNKAIFTFSDNNHQETKLELEVMTKSVAFDSENFVEMTISIPEVSKPQNQMFSYLWYAPIENTKAVYIQFNSYPSFEDMQIFGEELVGYISKNKFKQVVVDMRNNSGGDLYVGVVLAYALNLADTIDWKKGVYVMSDAITFSAATSNTALYKQLLNAKIIGQPTGSNPTGYQDMDQFELPNSKLVVTYSKRKFRLSETITQGVQPDVLLNYNWNDYEQGIDTMLQWIINDLNKK